MPFKNNTPDEKVEDEVPRIQHNNIETPLANGQTNNNSEVKGLIEEMVDSETVKIRRTGNRFATFKHPVKLSQKDIEIFRKHIEMLELLIE